MRFLKTNTATRITVGPFLDKTDGVTPETALTVTSCKLTFMVDDAGVPTLVLDTNPTASGGSNDMVHVTGDDAGFYDLELAAANVNYVGRAMIALTDAATHCPVFHEFTILPALVYDSIIGGTDNLQVDATQIEGSDATDQIRDALVDDATRIDASALNTLSSHDPGEAIMGATDLGTGAGLTTLATAANLATVDTVVDAIKLSTDNLPSDPADASVVAGLISALSAKVDAVDDYVDTEIAAIKTVVDAIKLATDNLPSDPADASVLAGLIAALEAKVDTIDNFVDTEVSAIKTVTDQLVAAQTEPSGAPAANETPLDKLGFIFAALRNKVTVTSSAKTFFDDGGSSLWSKSLSDDGTTYTETEGS